MANEGYRHGPHIERLRREVGDQFRVLGGNATLGEAKVICLATAHWEPHDRLVSSFITLNNNPQTVVLLEALGSDQGEFKGWQIQDYHLPINVRVRGWDDMAVLQTQLQAFQEIRTARDNSVAAGLDAEGLALLNARLTQLEEVSQRARILRNISMAQTIDEYPSETVIVVGGGVHFTGDPDLTAKLEKHKYIILAPKQDMPREAQLNYRLT